MGDESLADHSAAFAQELQLTLDAVLPGERRIVSRRFEAANRYIVQPEGETAAARRIPLHVDGQHLADLSVSIYLDMDRTGTYLKAIRSDIAVHSVLDRTPLLRLEYRTDMVSDPVAHWQLHAERGAFSHLLARAHAHRPKEVPKPHDLSSLHLPVGGERFRPCLEDVLQLLVVECGVDRQREWKAAVDQGRERWRRRQLAAAVRDVPSEAARVLRELGRTVDPPSASALPENQTPLRRW